VPFRHRLAIVATNKQGFIEKARAYLTREAAPDVFVGNKRSADALAGVLTGDEARDFTAALIKSRQWNKIASIWACGGAIELGERARWCCEAAPVVPSTVLKTSTAIFAQPSPQALRQQNEAAREPQRQLAP